MRERRSIFTGYIHMCKPFQKRNERRASIRQEDTPTNVRAYRKTNQIIVWAVRDESRDVGLRQLLIIYPMKLIILREDPLEQAATHSTTRQPMQCLGLSLGNMSYGCIV